MKIVGLFNEAIKSMHILLHTLFQIYNSLLRKLTLCPYYTSSQSKCNFMWRHIQIKCVFLHETINASIMSICRFLLYCACHLQCYCLVVFMDTFWVLLSRGNYVNSYFTCGVSQLNVLPLHFL